MVKALSGDNLMRCGNILIHTGRVSSSKFHTLRRQKADDYILETIASVRVVVGLDIDYKTNKGTISMWHPRYVENEQGQLELEATQTVYNEVRRSLLKYYAVVDMDQIFRDESGGPNLSPDAGLRLELKDFAPAELAEGIADSFLIDSAILCRFLNEAEHEEQETKQEQAVVHHLLPGAKKRRREETPPEESEARIDRKSID